ncbi:MAG TPA: hypothetical protein VJN69_02885, partial [Candidatus Acidoferrales bacterium]|nr:hypothetical protein [Candidatus Acidoferrales bacterium]
TACALDLAFWSLFLGTVVYGAGHLGVLAQSLNPWLRFVQVIGWLGIITTVIAIWNFFRVFGVSGRWWWTKIHETLIVLACLLSAWIVWFTHMLSFSMRY